MIVAVKHWMCPTPSCLSLKWTISTSQRDMVSPAGQTTCSPTTLSISVLNNDYSSDFQPRLWQAHTLKAVLGALPACILLTFHFSQEKFTEDVLQHACNAQMFIKILGRSLPIAHLMLLTHQILPFLLGGPHGKEWQAPSHIWYLTIKYIKYSRNMAAFLLCQGGVALFPWQLHFFTSCLCLSEANGAQPKHKCAIACWALCGGKATIPLPCPSRSKPSPILQKQSCRWAVRIKNWGHWEDKSGSEESKNHRWSTDKT